MKLFLTNSRPATALWALTIAFAALSPSAQAETGLTPQQTLQSIVTGTLEAVKLPKEHILNGHHATPGFCQIIRNGFDIERIAHSLVQASSWEQATPEQKKEYLDSVVSHIAAISSDLLVKTAAKMNFLYGGILPHRGLLEVSIHDKDSQKGDVIGRADMAQMPDSSYRIYDIYMGGYGMVWAKSREFKQLRTASLPVLTSALNEKASGGVLGGTCADQPAKVNLELLSSGGQLKHAFGNLAGFDGPAASARF